MAQPLTPGLRSVLPAARTANLGAQSHALLPCQPLTTTGEMQEQGGVFIRKCLWG